MYFFVRFRAVWCTRYGSPQLFKAIQTADISHALCVTRQKNLNMQPAPFSVKLESNFSRKLNFRFCKTPNNHPQGSRGLLCQLQRSALEGCTFEVQSRLAFFVIKANSRSHSFRQQEKCSVTSYSHSCTVITTPRDLCYPINSVFVLLPNASFMSSA